MFNLGTNFQITEDFQKKLNTEGEKMLNDDINEVILNIPNTKIKINFVQESVKEKYTSTIYKEIIVNDKKFYLAR